MEARKQQYYTNNSYKVDGNTARSLYVLPNQREYDNPDRIQQPGKEVKRRPKVNTGVDFFSLFIMTLAIVVTVYSCIEYLSVQSNISRMNKQIVRLENDLLKIQDENKAALSQINTSLDLNYIYQVATNELGMVFPNENQVISYESTLNDYVRQYEEIPEENKTTLIDKILN